jgi:aminoglycoside phosphotransferase family enzyme/predicted kinase
MQTTELIDALRRPEAYPHPVGPIDVRQTHISVVFLAGPYAYKVKKPVSLGFLDFSTLAKRRHFCQEEVRVNRRLAPSVYEDVVPITRDPSGIRIDGAGEPVEWAVRMKRLPEEATLESRLARGEISPAMVEALAVRIARFHADADSGPHVAAFARWQVVAGNARENFEQAGPLVGMTLSEPVCTRLRALTEESLRDQRSLIEERAAGGAARDTHGDLHLDHIYVFPERPPPDDLVVVDCIEFNERFRYADPVADMAFLVMDLRFHDRKDLAAVLTDAYFSVAGTHGRPLLPFYVAYRAAVRGKVAGIKLSESEVSAADKMEALADARGHWLLALGELEAPARRPCLLLVAGLPGTGKSTLARDLAAIANATVIRSDVVRKGLAGVQGPAQADFGAGLYTGDWTDRTYAECRRRAEAILFDGGRVIVDATFAEEHRRRDFLDMARRWRVPAALLVCEADAQAVRQRLAQRVADASDAGWSVYEEIARRWQNPGAATLPFVHVIRTDDTGRQSLAQAVAVLKQWTLFEAR